MIRRMKRCTTISLLVPCLFVTASGRHALAAPAQGAAPTRKACDFLTKADAEALLGATVQDRSQGADCLFVETGWTNKPPRNKAIRFGLTDSALPQPDEVVNLRRNNEQYLPPGGFIRDISGFADAAYWLWIPGFGGTLTAFRGGKTTVSVNITGLPEEEALRKAETLAARPLGGSGATGFAYNKPSPPARPPTPAASTPAAAASRPSPPTATASATVLAKVANPHCAEPRNTETAFDRFAHTYSFRDGPTLREYMTLAPDERVTFVINCAKQMAAGYPEGETILAKFANPVSEGVDKALGDVAVDVDLHKGASLDESVAGSAVKRRFIRYVVATRLSVPKSAAWVDTVLGSLEPILLKGLVNADFRSFDARRSRGLGYIVAFNEQIAEDCPAAYDKRISDDARQAAGRETPETEAGKKAGERDAELLMTLAPDHCDNRMLPTIIASMRGYLASRK